jgi:ribosome-associated heat shock protein Hsp15
MPEAILSQRLDKWLWAARFYKTRSLAVAAINGGKVQWNGQRARPAREIRPGDRLVIHKDDLEWVVEVLGLNLQRRPAPEAVLLYREDPDSLLRRTRLREERRLLGHSGPGGERPTKRDRRLIHRFTDTPD